ncbi:MAG: hypothetical protein ACTHK0_07355 [Ginsengibacter sp.]
MNKSDKCIIIAFALSILINIIVFVAGLIKHKVALYFSVINALTGLAIIVYWLQREMSVTQHFIEAREVMVLLAEALVIAISIYAISTASFTSWVKITQYIIFGIHFICLIFFLIFMLTFKFNKLI